MKSKRTTYFLYAYGLVIFVFLIFRCLWVPPYPDEILNFHVYVDSQQFIPFYAFPDANNHLISTFFNWVSFHLFGPNVIWMRFFELMAFPLFFIYLVKIAAFFQNKIAAVGLVLTASSGIFFLTFFALARGYGMSIAFLTVAIYYLLIVAKNRKPKHFLLVTIFCSLTIWCNLSMTITILILMLFLTYYLLIKNENYKASDKVKTSLAIVFIGFVPIGIAIFYSFYLKAAGALWLGGTEGFIPDVIVDLSQSVFGLKGVWYSLFIGASIIITVLLSLKKIKVNEQNQILTILAIGTLVGTILLHLVLGVNYPQNRASLHIYLLIILFVFIWLDQVKLNLQYATLIPAAVIIAHHLVYINMSYPYYWRFATMNKGLYNCIVTEQNESGPLLTINGPFYFGENVHYYNYLEPSPMNNVQWSDYPSDIADLMIVNSIDKVANKGVFDTLYYHPSTQVSLLKRKNPTPWKFVTTLNPIDTISNDSIIHLFELKFDSEYNNALVDFKSIFRSNEKVKFASLEFKLKNQVGETIKSESIVLNQYRQDFTNGNLVEKSVYFANINFERYLIEIDILNPRRYDWNVREMEIQLFSH